MTYQSHNGGRGSPQTPEEIIADIIRKLDQFFNNVGQKPRNIAYFVGAVLTAFMLFTTFYTVQPDEEAVIVRLGKYQGTYPPGLHFKLPFGIDHLEKLKTKLVHQAEFGFRTESSGPGRKTIYSNQNLKSEASMLTGDLNVADVEWVVHYQISDPFKYLFQASDPVRNLRDVSESILRRVVGDRVVTEVLTTGRLEMAADAQVLMQEVLDKYDIGIRVVAIKLQDINPPEIVKPSFNEVVSAKQEQEKLINEAEEAYNKVIPEARGKSEKVVSEARGYAAAIVNRATGDAEKFGMVLKEYQRAPAITRKRIYLETMEELYSRFNGLTIVDSKVKGIMPIFGDKSSADAVSGGVSK
jgi:modulator of FtsH protease HflK